MAAIHLQTNADNPNGRHIEQAARIMEQGGIAILPTDTVYAFAISIDNRKGFEAIARIKGLKPGRSHFSLVCNSLSQVAQYTQSYPRAVFELINRSLPGPFTFILPAGKEASRLFSFSKNEIGIRIPNHQVCQALVTQLGKPMVVSSVVSETSDDIPYLNDPFEMWERYQHQVDIVLDAGLGNLDASTIVNCTSGEPVVVREGLGKV